MGEKSDRALTHVPALISGAFETLRPFAAAWNALPEDIRKQPSRNLADVLGIFAPDDQPALTVGDLAAVINAYALLAPSGAVDVKL